MSLNLDGLGIAALAGGSVQTVAEGVAREHSVATTLLWIAIIIVVARFSSVVERLGQPAVLGELVAGVIVGNLVLLGINVFEPIKDDTVIAFLAELGVVILLFQIGLETDIGEMRRVGGRALMVASIGVIVPFVLGTYIVGPWLLSGLSFSSYLFLGATLTATSVGITAKVFRDLGKMQSPEARIVLGAAVIDDVLGLVILAIVSAVVTVGAISLGSIGWIFVKAIVFLAAIVGLGHLAAPKLAYVFSRVHDGVSMKLTLALGSGLFFAYLADRIGLAPIVGAFAAGLVLEPAHFRHFQSSKVIEDLRQGIRDVEPELRERIDLMIERHADRHVEDIIEPLSHFVVPVFFVTTGMALKLDTLFNLPILLVALGITAAAVIGKVASGLVAGKVKRSAVGWGMVPRGEVGLIFAAIGRSLGVVSDEVFSVIVIVVMLTTFLTPPVLTLLLRRA